MLDCPCRHEFSYSNAWTALTDVPPKELRWPLCTGWTLDWIGLDLFNDDTRPSGHISRPTQVNVSELLSFSKQLLKSNNIVQSGG